MRPRKKKGEEGGEREKRCKREREGRKEEEGNNRCHERTLESLQTDKWVVFLHESSTALFWATCSAVC